MALATSPLIASNAAAQAPALDGVWKVANVTTTGANAATNASPQPGIMIFSKGYYSNVSVNGADPRPAAPAAKDPAKLTDAEKIARFEEWNAFTGQTGAYEIKGSTLILHPIAAKSVGVMAPGNTLEQTFAVTSNTLVLTLKSSSGPASERRITLTRIN